MAGRALLLFVLVAIATVSWMATCALWHYRQVAAEIAPLEPRVFEPLTVVTVGTGGAYENPSRVGPATAIGLGSRVVLVDCGRAVAEALRRARIPVAQPDTIYLSSLLPENTLGLDDLLLTGWLAPRGRPVRLVGPPGTRALADGLAAAYRGGIDALVDAVGLPPEGARLLAVEVDDGWSEERDGLSAHAVALEGGPVPGIAWRFEAGRKVVVVGGPGWDPDGLVRAARGADLLVHAALHRASVEMAIEAGAPDPERLRREAALYTPTDGVGRLASRAGVVTLALVRLRPPPLYEVQYRNLVAEQFGGRVVIAEDGEELIP